MEGEHVVAALSAERVDSETTQQQKRVIVEALESVGELQIKHVFTQRAITALQAYAYRCF